MSSDNPHAEIHLTKRVSENDTGSTIDSEKPPREKRCGLEDVDTIVDGLLVLAPLDQVAEVVAESGVRWERDIYGQELRGRGLILFQFQGHVWTGILNGGLTDQYRDILDGFYISDVWNWESQGISLSQKLNTRTIHYWFSDTSGCIGYACWENGTLMEKLEYDEDTWQDTHDEALWEAPDRTCEPHLFESKLRQLTAAEIEDSYGFVDEFLCEQQAYAATRFSAFNIKRDDLIRLDYIAFA
ncbi:hypothetical protein [Gloeocapsopsis dulcis]|uniref:Uncharacterized protein n=1 Tax=Gloeocapsopsis dulcis AAB1 = 1H9 TaxID=1433147 RepID=A0A6N8FZE3_9CHRO|nr:hypothetical protein [Gloeocapsopsis dulcis]MUL38321.1 hypothetical protein [Gloeocapsopsis dulcis AAB1 = 1H9]WNN91182.1 hypothetical protein P0S91_08950 [Gloeocapsopsis dulcis]